MADNKNETTEKVDLADVQGNVLRGYRKSNVRHLVLEVVDAADARRWAGEIVAPSSSVAPRITDAADWGAQPPEVCFNVGVTCDGLVAMGVPDDVADSFPIAFREGMAARADKIGDWGDASPEHWQEWFRPGAAVHLIVSLHANDDALIDDFEKRLMSGLAGSAFRVTGRNDGANFDGGKVHFGYEDNISQPRFKGISPPGRYDDQPFAPLGTVLLGYRTAFEELTWALPKPHELGFNGAFNAYRVLEQDVAAFEAFLERGAKTLLASDIADELLPPGSESKFGPNATRESAMVEVVAAKLLGRWRTGTPLERSPHDPNPDPPVSLTDFDYTEDLEGLKCPLGSHTRRANPRGGKIVQKVANHTRRIVRRGIPYGPAWDPSAPDDVERGLLGNFICGSLSAQFEAIQYDWINLGLQDPRITDSNDPLLGANEESSSWIDITTASGTVRLRGFPRMIRPRGGAYTFIPSLTALRWLSAL